MMMLKLYVRRLTKNINQSNTIYEIEKKNFYLANSFFQSTIKLLPTDPWILHSHRNNNIVKYLHERCLWLIYNDNSSSFLQQMQTQLTTYEFTVAVELLQYDLCYTDHKIFHFLDLTYGMLSPQT